MNSVLLVLLLMFSGALNSPKAVFYTDNGLDQTAIDGDVDNSQKRELEAEILGLLGLPRRPKRGAKSLKKSAPQFLLDVYESLVVSEERSRSRRSADLNLSGEEQSAIEESDVIMTVESTSTSHHVNETGKRLWFNVSGMPTAENVVGAQLRIFQKQINSLEKLNVEYTVAIHELVKTESGERELEFVSAVNTTGGSTGWLVLNLTACLPTWVSFPHSNKGLYLSVRPVNNPGGDIRPEDIGLTTANEEEESQPFLVAFLKSTDANEVRRKRSTRKASSNRSGKHSDYASVMNPPSGTWSSCGIHTLFISFKELQWQDWIIAPEGFSAYYCAGECNFPLNSNMNATNHAIIQTLVHMMNPAKFPRPCCAPKKLSNFQILYFLDDANVMMKKLKNMLVDTCGCH